MIENEEQYAITKGWLDRFSRDFVELQAQPDQDSALNRLRRDALAGKIASLREEIAAFDMGIRHPVPGVALPLPSLALPLPSDDVEEVLRQAGQEYRWKTNRALLEALDREIPALERQLAERRIVLGRARRIQHGDPLAIARLQEELAHDEEVLADWKQQRDRAQLVLDHHAMPAR